MQVLNVVKYYYPSKGGMETFVQILCEGLYKKGIQSTIIAINHKRSWFDSYELINHLSVYRTNNIFKILSQPLSLSLGKKFIKIIGNFDLIHVNCPFPNAEIYYKYLKKKPLVITWHADPSMTRWNKLIPLYRIALNKILQHAERIVVTSPNLLNYSPSLFPYKNKCVIVPLPFCMQNKGLNHLNNSFMNSRILFKDVPTILFVGALRPYKGLRYLIRAMCHIKSANLKIIGTGEEEKSLIKLVKNLGLQSRVSFLGNVTDEELVRYYQESYLFVLPSIAPSEAFGIVQLEAMSFGLPVINTDLLSGVPFVSLNNITGFTVPPRDEYSLANAINCLINDHALYRKFSNNALTRSSMFSEDKVVSSYLNIYEDCIKSYNMRYK